MKGKLLAIATILSIHGIIPPVTTLAYAENAPKDTTHTKLSWVQPQAASLHVTLSSKFTNTGERILNVDLVREGEVVKRLQAVSGKPQKQAFRVGSESRSGSREPLPQGIYAIGQIDRGVGLPLAMGNTFIPVTPQFSTSRSGIGIHRDADRMIPGGSGTIGCLGLLNQTGIETVAEFISIYNVKTLIVDYGLK
ncbi:hypothetical protein JOY44_10265 [Phormidium sp. CLA17]|uniref:hypothetical protein n=1 Tax=Leptolyngbya sp. Cla-17 TaxID=2803751 RepID=UPI001492988C|nr:hypothetical protein [Leptolyngbya sp. Cla-17]MBM0742005.1 hypothetical protein [Leptolyngbya sp. Cla-17]